MQGDIYDPSLPNDYKNYKQIETSTFISPPPKSRTETSKIVVILNMVNSLDEECEDDIRTEASRYGPVLDFAVHLDEGSRYPVQFYIKFNSDIPAELFLKGMNGRFYDGRQIIAASYSEAEFAKNSLGVI